MIETFNWKELSFESFLKEYNMEKQELAKRLKSEMHAREVEFKYMKKDGSERNAVGTLNPAIYGEENEPTGSGRSVPENQVRYFDINAQGWRSFLVENLISYE